jgi:hypothetical protein
MAKNVAHLRSETQPKLNVAAGLAHTSQIA